MSARCERCGAVNIVGMWSPDGLPGHEILVCDPCWRWLTEPDEPTAVPVSVTADQEEDDGE